MNDGSGPALRGVSGGEDGVKGQSTARNGSGVYGHSAGGPGVKGRSENDVGVVGWTGAAEDKSGVLGHSENAVGVAGHSNTNDGVAGWTGAGDKSGVFGRSERGVGATGRSGGNDGLLGVTTSQEPGHAGLRARNEGGGPAIFCEGDLYITGAIRGNLGPKAEGAALPRPAYNSGWQVISMEGTLVGLDAYRDFPHELGGDPNNYVVDLQFRSGNNIHHKFYGNYHIKASLHKNNVSPGAYWSHLTDQSIRVWRGWSASDLDWVRVRIWVYK